MSSSVTGLPASDAAAAVSGAPGIPAGFADTFASWYVDSGEVRLHAVIGGEGLNDRLWHLGFNRIDGLNELLVAGRSARRRRRAMLRQLGPVTQLSRHDVGAQEHSEHAGLLDDTFERLAGAPPV